MDLRIKPLTPELLDHFINFFDNIAFSDNPDWSGCYCHYYHFPGTMEQWREATNEHNRNATINLIKEDKMNGLLAFANNEPVGWCNFNFKNIYEKVPIESEHEESLEGKVASVVCFLIAPDYRKKGVARKLLKHAIKILKEKSYAWIEAYPRKQIDLSDAHSYHGPKMMFSSEGFEVVKEDENFVLMRRSLA
jgi:ribosomal protein S18 acetylase RimI-like enzyme